MKKVANLLIVIGSGLAVYGLSGWRLDTLWQPGRDIPEIWAAWLPQNQLEITVGIMLLVLGLILREDSN